jgi:hypothetical protein
MADRVLFYDSSACQIRKLAGGRLSTFSGPRQLLKVSFTKRGCTRLTWLPGRRFRWPVLVVDRAAHAIRVVDSQGHTSTLVGRLNQDGLIKGPLPAGLSAPVDVVVHGKDLLISSDKLPNLILVQGVL